MRASELAGPDGDAGGVERPHEGVGAAGVGAVREAAARGAGHHRVARRVDGDAPGLVRARRAELPGPQDVAAGVEPAQERVARSDLRLAVQGAGGRADHEDVAVGVDGDAGRAVSRAGAELVRPHHGALRGELADEGVGATRVRLAVEAPGREADGHPVAVAVAGDVDAHVRAGRPELRGPLVLAVAVEAAHEGVVVARVGLPVESGGRPPAAGHVAGVVHGHAKRPVAGRGAELTLPDRLPRAVEHEHEGVVAAGMRLPFQGAARHAHDGHPPRLVDEHAQRRVTCGGPELVRPGRVPVGSEPADERVAAAVMHRAVEGPLGAACYQEAAVGGHAHAPSVVVSRGAELPRPPAVRWVGTRARGQHQDQHHERQPALHECTSVVHRRPSPAGGPPRTWPI